VKLTGKILLLIYDTSSYLGTFLM